MLTIGGRVSPKKSEPARVAQQRPGTNGEQLIESAPPGESRVFYARSESRNAGFSLMMSRAVMPVDVIGSMCSRSGTSTSPELRDRLVVAYAIPRLASVANAT